MVVQQQVAGYITAESVVLYTDWGLSIFCLDWLHKALEAEKRGNKLVVYEVDEVDTPFDLRGTDFDCGDPDGVYSLGSTSGIIMPPDGMGNG